MVKGVSRRIIVVDSPDPKIFERAVFIVREDPAAAKGISEAELLRQARQAVGGYFPAGDSPSGRWLGRLRAVLCAFAGAAAAALAWVMIQMAHL